MKIVLIGHYWTGFQATFRSELGERHELLFYGTPDDPGLEQDMATAHVVVTSALPTALGRAGRQLRLVHSGGAGVDKIDMSVVAAGVPLCCTFHHGPSIAEHVVMAIIALHRGLFRQDRELREGRWRNPGIDPRVELHATLEGETLLVLGTGEIGSHVAARSAPFGMRVVGINRSGRIPEGSAFEEVGPWAALDEWLPRADFLVLALPLTEETHGAIDERRLGLMKLGACLINVARGPLVDEAALFEALESRRLAGAALDVWYNYPRNPDTPTLPAALPFHRLDNVILTPHSSGNTTATFSRRAADVIANIERLERGEPLRNTVAPREHRE